MTHRPFPLFLVLAATIVVPASIAVNASDPEDGARDPPSSRVGVALPAPLFPHVRALDPQTQAFVAEAMDSSAIVRALVERIAASDVIVFVACERDSRVRAHGRLNFMAAAGGLRYVLIRLKPKRRAAAIAMLAHELQHAAEVADAPSIVDEPSLAREYARIGYRSDAAPGGGVAFDTKAAVDTGRRVAEELTALKTSAAD